MNDDKINHLLSVGPKDAQFVGEFSDNIYLFQKIVCYVSGEMELSSFYNLITGKQSPWFQTKEKISDDSWFLFDGFDEVCFYNLITGKQSDWFRFQAKEDLGDGWWLLTNREEESCFYNSITGKQFPWFQIKENLGSNRWLLTNKIGECSFYNLITGKQSPWFQTKEDFGKGLWLLTGKSFGNDIHYLYNFITRNSSLCFQTKEELRDELLLLNHGGDVYSFFNPTNGKQSPQVSFKTKEKLDNGLWLLIDENYYNRRFFNPNTLRLSDWLFFKRYEIAGQNVRCFSSFNTFAVLNMETMEYGHFQII